ncbi:MAG: enoyl-CoA hydratase-related protein [Sphingobium sp.]|nr:enoyl-CoA hydratase-related protein [Sphingobium sp.]
MDLKVTRLQKEDTGVAIVTLDRPGRGNSWTSRMNAEYRWIMAQLDVDPDVRVIVLTGGGNQFCVGADFKALDFYKEGDKDYVATVRADEMAKPGYGIDAAYDHDLVWHWGLTKPVIAAINGACAGIAMGLVSFCDLRFAVEGAKMTTSTPRLGLPAEYGLAWLLPRIVGVTNAADILLTGRIIVAEDMRRMGFLNDVFPTEGFLDRVLEIARSIATTVSPAAAAVSKHQLYAELITLDVGEAIEDSKRRIGAMMRNADYKEGVKALTERRPAKFAPLDKSVDALLNH